MGTDKSALVVEGRPMVVRVSDALWEAGCSPVVCQGGDSDLLGSFGLTTTPDSRPGDGPIAAIRDALQRHEGPVVISACDLPDLQVAAVQAVISAALAADSVAVAVSDGRRHLLSCWPASALDAVSTAITVHVESYRALLDAVGAVEVPVDAASMRNVNEPSDVR
jgi:molybdopterin-guanine dinucleotide biosynthesis protein A